MIATSENSTELTAEAASAGETPTLTTEEAARASKVANNLLLDFGTNITGYLTGRNAQSPEKVERIVFASISRQLQYVFKGKNLDDALSQLRDDVSACIEYVVKHGRTQAQQEVLDRREAERKAKLALTK